MGFVSRFALAAALTGALAFAHPALAGCKRMGFTVNDYGKEGPTRDAKDLLDKHIATWAAEQGIEKYTVGKKDVSCELFLNLIIVDEHTCTASATVCWGPDINKPKLQDAKTTPEKKKDAPAKSESKSAGSSETAKPKEKSAEKSDAKPEQTAADSKPEEPKQDETKAADATTPEATPSSEPEVETGAIPVPPTAAGAAAAVSPTAVEPAASADSEASKAAAAAAESAAAAAERAAAAAERAAEAAERAAKAMAEQQQLQQQSATPPAESAPSTSASSSVPVAPVSPTP